MIRLRKGPWEGPLNPPRDGACGPSPHAPTRLRGGRRRVWVTLGVGLSFATAAGLVLAVARAGSPRDPALPPGHDLAPGEPGGPSASAPAGAAPTPAPTVRIVFKVFPPNRATVHWGKRIWASSSPRRR